MSAAIILRQPDRTIESKARSAGLPVIITARVAPPWPADRVLITEPGVAVPWELLPAGWKLLEQWDAAVPLWRHGILAANLGTPDERKRTEELVRDLRIPVYACELLFVRASSAGQDLVRIWQEEIAGGDVRLAFLRAFYRVRPLLCVLPRTWLADVHQRSYQDARVLADRARLQAPALTRVQIGPGRWVRCRPGEEERVKRHFQQLMAPRGDRE